jgi:hypothetical protein
MNPASLMGAIERIAAQAIILDEFKLREKEISQTGLIGRAAKVAIINLVSHRFNPRNEIVKETTKLFFEEYSNDTKQKAQADLDSEK